MESDLHFTAGDRLIVGNTIITLGDEFVSQLKPGDKVLAVASTSSVKRIPAEVSSLVDDAMSRATRAFSSLGSVSSSAVTAFFEEAARLLEDDGITAQIQEINLQDVEKAKSRGRSTTRLIFTESMRRDMIAAFEMWRTADVSPEVKFGEIVHDGWRVEQWRAPLGVIGFVFEGRPNVFADATGVLRTGNSVVFRIGSDALETAKVIMSRVIDPAIARAGLPKDCVVLLDSPEHAAGWSLFSDNRLALAVARGSGEAVAELGSIARQSGVSVSLHGTGGAWAIVGENANAERVFAAVTNSLDRKVCNTVNVICVTASRSEELIPLVFEAAEKAAATRGVHARIHAVCGAEVFLPKAQEIDVFRTDGVHREEQITVSSIENLSHEFEWEANPEIFLVAVQDVSEAIALFNAYSPQFIVSVLSEDEAERDAVWRGCNAPFAGDGFTRWVDGQFALLRPELGLSNWEGGRLFARGGVLSGDSAFTVRLKVIQSDIHLHR